MKTLEDLQPKFIARPRREKVLLVAFLVALGLVWLFSLVDRARAAYYATATIQSDASDQQSWLRDQEGIEARFEAAITALRETPTPPRLQVAAELQALLRKHGLERFRIPDPERVESDGLGITTFSIRISNASFSSLYAFHNELSAVLPQANIAEIQLSSPVRRNSQPNESPPIDAQLKLVAVEITP